MKIVITSADSGQRLDKLVAKAVAGLGRSGAKRLFAEGRVRVLASGAPDAVLARGDNPRGRRAQKGDVTAEGQVVDIEIEETVSDATPDAEAPLVVLLETERALVLEKPAGQATAPLQPGERGTLANALLARFPEVASCGFSTREPGLCHRLDTDTSGLVLAARDKEAWEHLVTALKGGQIDKRYALLCKADGLPEAGTIDIPMAPHPKDRRRVLACLHPRDVAREKPREASTSFRVLKIIGDLALVEARAPRALRHQIRAHFAALGHPLLGDELYGAEPDPRLGRHALHAFRIAWGGDVVVPAFTVTSDLPADLAAITGAEALAGA